MRKRSMSILLLVLLVVLAAGCGERKKRVTDGSDVYVSRQETKTQEKPEDEEQEEPEDKKQEQQDIYAVTAIDLERQILTLRNCQNAVEVPYEYTGGTYIRDKYEHDLTASQLSVGELVTIEQQGEKLTTVQIAKDAFSYDDLYNFTLDREMQSLTVGGSIYYYDDDLLAYQEGSSIPLSELSEQDTVCIKGVGQEIYTLQVMTGHGVVALENTELFLGGYITIGNLLSQKITPQMRVEVAEGTYLLAVANDGYGGSREITVEANKETKVDLDELKGDGPSFCQIEFAVTPENAEVFLDGEQLDFHQPIQVRYGTHHLTAKADGYVEWTRKLIVNSATAKLKIEMTTVEEAEQEEDTISTANPPENNNTNNNSNNNSNSNNSSNNNNNTNNTNNNNSNNNNSSNNTNNNNSNNTNNNSNNNTNNNKSNNNNSNNSNNNSSNNNNTSNNNNNNNSTTSDMDKLLDALKKLLIDKNIDTSNLDTDKKTDTKKENDNHDDHDVSDHDKNNSGS